MQKQKKWKYIPSIPAEIEIKNMSLIEMFRETVDKYPDRNYLHFMGKDKTYAEVDKEVNKFAHSLKELGVKKNDVVAILAANCPQYVVAFFAIQSIGAISTAISPLYSEKEIRFQLADSGAKVIVTIDLFLDRIRKVQEDTALEHIIVSSIADELPLIKKVLYTVFKGIKNPKVKDEIKYKNFIKRGKNTRIHLDIDPKEKVAVLQYTGGTTGTQKGAMLTDYNLVSQSTILSHWDLWIGDKRPKGQYIIAGVLPYSHIFGFTGSFLWPTYVAAHIFLVPDPRNLEYIMSIIDKHGIHYLNGVPVLFQKMAEHENVDKYDLSSLVMCIAGGETLPKTTVRKFEDKTGNILIEGYGLSEAAPVTHVNPARREDRKTGTIGIPIPNVDVILVDPQTNKEVTEQGKSGEIWVRGPGVMKGYWNNKEATDNVFEKGWLRTGDVATVDENGFFTIVDRLKHMIIVSGYKVWPTEVEEVLYNHDAINMAAVVPTVTDHGTVVKAYLVKEKGHEQLSLDEVRSYCKKHMAPYKVPKAIEYTDELPRSPFGKVLRRALVEREISRATSTTESGAANLVKTTQKISKTKNN